MQSIDITLDDDPVFNVRLRALSSDTEVERAAQCIAAVRDAAADGLFDTSLTTERNFWLARAATCRERGVAWGVFINGGGPVGGVFALLVSPVDGQRCAEVYACNSLIDSENIEPLMQAALRKVAAEQGIRLLRNDYTPTTFGPDDKVFGPNNEVLPAVRMTRHSVVDF